MIIKSFGRITDQKSILKAISYFNIENIKKKSTPLVMMEESEYIELTSKHFNLEHCVLVKEEYWQLKPLIIKDYNSLDALSILKKIFEEDHLSLATSNAQCERSFSQTTYIKNRWRNRIGPASLNSLLHISLNSQSKKKVNFQSMYFYWK